MVGRGGPRDWLGCIVSCILKDRVFSEAFDTVWIDGLLYKLTLLNFPSYTVHIISSYIRGRTFEASFQTATTSRRCMRAAVAQGGLISPILFSLYVNDMPSPSHHVELALTGKLLDSAYMNNYKSWVQNVCAMYKGFKFCLCLCSVVNLSMISHPLSSLLNPLGY